MCYKIMQNFNSLWYLVLKISSFEFDDHRGFRAGAGVHKLFVCCIFTLQHKHIPLFFHREEFQTPSIISMWWNDNKFKNIFKFPVMNSVRQRLSPRQIMDKPQNDRPIHYESPNAVPHSSVRARANYDFHVLCGARLVPRMYDLQKHCQGGN